MIRPTVPSDTPALVALARGTEVFKPMEITTLGEVLDDYHAGAHARGDRAITYELHGKPIGFAYFGPAAMTDRTWELWWIAVEKQTHARGIGSALLRHIESEARAAGGRLLVIETSSQQSYEPTRRFYLKHGYEQAATIADYYADGDDIVYFRKRLVSDGKGKGAPG
jgi:ribosomal protein S18 acetylase RimI-like enzyme